MQAVGRDFPDRVRGLPNTLLALAYAEQAHAGHRREITGAPYIEHPSEVAALLYYAGEPDHVIAAGALHDTLEKTATQPGDLDTRFGHAITSLVLALTEDATVRDVALRKARLRAQIVRSGPEALSILAADKISNVRALAQVPRTGVITGRVRRPDRHKLAHYRASLTELERHLPDSPLVAQLRAAMGTQQLLSTVATRPSARAGRLQPARAGGGVPR